MSTYITVIVPVYNIEKYLGRCIDSILAQSYKNFELILVDDGSTDSSGIIIDDYAKRDERIIAIHKENGGSSSARNCAIDIARGEYISFIDSDDYIDSDFLETLMAPIERAKKAGFDVPRIVQVGRDEINELGELMPDICSPPSEEVFVSSEEFFKSLILHVGDCSFCTKLTERELFKSLRFPVGKLNEDFFLLINMLDKCDGVINLPGHKYHVFYRVGSNSRKIDKNDFSRVYQDCIDNADFVEKMVEGKGKEIKEIAVRFALFQRLEYMLHIPISFMNKGYVGYSECVKYIRNHFPKFIFNKYLTAKNKVYLLLLATAPKAIRIIHAKIKRL